MLEMKYKTLRSILGILKDERMNAAVRIQESKIKKTLKENKEGVIVLSYPTFEEGKLTHGTFYFWKPEKNSCYDHVYDIMFPNSIIINEHPDFRDLKFFQFEQSAANDSEIANVLHVDPFLAYLSLRKDGQIRANNQYLKNVKEAKLGWNDYRYVCERDDDW